MRNVQLLRQYDRIKSLIERTAVASQGDINLQNDWSGYICILSAGLLESSIREIYGEFVRNAAINPASSRVSKYAISRLERVSNPKADSFVQTARAFSEEWGQDLENYLNSDDGQRKNAIDSIMNNRNQIAHGRRASVSLARVKDYLSKAAEVIDFIESQCDSN